jgi:hypothetical protein
MSGLKLPISLAHGTSVTVVMEFKPYNLGRSSGQVNIVSDAANSTAQYQMTGTGTGLQVLATPSSSSFGNVPVGITNTQTIVLKNQGVNSVTISKVTVSGTGFHFANLKTPFILYAGSPQTFTVGFTPTSAASVEGSLVIESTGTNPALSIPLKGAGISNSRAISVSPSSLSFGKDAVGKSQTLAVSLKNTGNSSVAVSGISVSDAQLGVNGGIAGATLAPGQTATLDVIYSPKIAGNFSGQVKVNSNASNSPSTISIAGTAFAPTTGHTVALNWKASASPGVDGYYVYRSTSPSGGFVRLDSAYISGFSYSDNTVASGTTYYYSVSAVNTQGVESLKSAEAIVSVP